MPVELLLGKKDKKKDRLSRSPSKKEESSEEEELTDKAEVRTSFGIKHKSNQSDSIRAQGL